MTTKAPAVGMGLILLALLVVIGWSVWTPPPLRFLTRADLPTCPPVSADQLAAAPQMVGGCLFDQRARREGAELVVTSMTDEGDKVRTYYRVVPQTAGLEVWSDMSGDRYGGGWEHQVCPEAVSLAALGTCQTA
ncbi:hypothetical protein [Kineococcus sp. SYSU DK003]|uniref:hypothetical protein n=1 Tax=Kineococcus sp. SYSU DK003 TaxID=3383124 RepID=UPI003D7C80A4